MKLYRNCHNDFYHVRALNLLLSINNRISFGKEPHFHASFSFSIPFETSLVINSLQEVSGLAREDRKFLRKILTAESNWNTTGCLSTKNTYYKPRIVKCGSALKIPYLVHYSTHLTVQTDGRMPATSSESQQALPHDTSRFSFLNSFLCKVEQTRWF